MAQEKEYFAFISYQREDEKWAKWLADQLDNYKLPSTLNGKELPPSLRKTFRDVDELSAGNLPEQIYKALSASDNLIVICSPRSAKSEWVNKEIEDFINSKSGKTDHIFPFIIDGIPYSNDSNIECFPEKLRKLPKKEERLGGNINDQGGRNAAVVKIIAGMLGIGFDSLWQKYEREKRKKKVMVISAAVFAFLCVSGIAIWMYWQKLLTEEANWKMMVNQARAVASVSNSLVDDGNPFLARKLSLELFSSDRPYVAEAEAALRNALKASSFVLKGHEKEVRSAVFGNDGKTIVSGSLDGRILLHDISTGQDEIFAEGLTQPHSLAFSPNENKIAFVSSFREIHVWDFEKKRQLRILTGHDAGIYTVAYSNDGMNMVSASIDGTIRIWDAKSGKCMHILRGHTTAVRSAYFSHDNKRVVSASEDRTIRIWDVEKEICLKVYRGHTNVVNTAIFFNDDKNIASGAWDNTIRIWDVETGECVKILKNHMDYVWDLTLSPDGKCFASASCDGTVCLWDINSMSTIDTFEGHHRDVNTVNFSPNGKYIVTASEDRTIRVWNLNKQRDEIIINNHSGRFWRALYNPKSYEIAAISYDDVIIYNSMTYKPIKTIKGNLGNVTSISFSPDGNFFASSCNKTVMIWDCNTWECIKELNSDRSIRTTSFSADNKYLIFMDDLYIYVWDVYNNKYVYKQIKYYSNYHTASASFLDNNIILFTSEEKGKDIIYLRNIVTNEECKLFEGYSAILSPDRRYVLALRNNATANLWDIKNRECLVTLTGHTANIAHASFNSDGSKIVTASYDKTIRVWDTKSGVCLCVFEGHTKGVNSISFSSDDTRLLSASEDNTIRIWNFIPFQKLLNETKKVLESSPLSPEERRKYYLE